MKNFRPTNDRLSKHKSRTIEKFSGVHYGIAKEKQPNQFAGICDLRMLEEKPELREGKKKIDTEGFDATVTSMFPINLGGDRWLGIIVDGVLQARHVDDVITQDRKYYTWDEVRQTWSVDGLEDEKTWDALLNTRNRT